MQNGERRVDVAGVEGVVGAAEELLVLDQGTNTP
jgi:hypothetical protein